MKTLIVKFLPRGERSHTKKLLDAFLAQVKDQDIEILDLTKDVPDFFLDENLSAYVERNYLGKELSKEREQLLVRMDFMVDQLKAADLVVIAFPMHNFSVPAVVKAYFDSVLQKDATWTVTDQGYLGLLKGKKALILMASGGVYEGDYASLNKGSTLVEQYFGFMGMEDVRTVTASGMNQFPPDQIDQIIAAGIEKVQKIASEWYG